MRRSATEGRKDRKRCNQTRTAPTTSTIDTNPLLLVLLLIILELSSPVSCLTLDIISSENEPISPHRMHNGIDYYSQSAIRPTTDGQKQRTGHVSSLWPLTLGGELNSLFVSFYAAAYMAVEHFNNRSSAVIPELPELLKDCDFLLTSEVRDDQMSRRKAIQELTDALYGDKEINPFAIFGSLSSGVSQPLSVLTDVFQLVQITGTATSTDLEQSQHFTRTVATNQGESAALMAHLNSIGIDRLGVLYIQDPYGESFHNSLFKEARKTGISVVLSVPYMDDNLESIETSMTLLKKADVKYIVAIVNAFDWKPVLRIAHQNGLMGHDSGRQWYLAEYQDMQKEDFALDATTELDLADALHGLGIVYLYSQNHVGFDRAMENFLLEKDLEEVSKHTTSMRQRFIASHIEADLYNGFEFTMEQPNTYHYLLYDAMMALGVAACRTPGQFTTAEFYEQLLKSEFPGASGWVALDQQTGTRMPKDLEYRIDNILVSPSKSTNTMIRFTYGSALSIQGENITKIGNDFVNANNSTNPPPGLPPLAYHEYNLIPLSVLAVGWVLGASVILLSISCMIWTFLNRNNHVVRVSQPIFLCQLCAGTFIMGLAIIPLSMQEQEDDYNNISSRWDLDAACMATPWLVCLGFVISVSALLAKTLRLNTLMRKSKGMKRIVVSHTDVLQPLIIMMTCNVVLLMVCNIVAPYTWHRIPSENNVDVYGRSLESYGTCQHMRPVAAGTDTTTYYLMIPVWLVNVAGVWFAAYQCYLAWNLPTELSETSYLFGASVSLLEVFIIGGPILFLPQGSPTMYYLVFSSVISMASLSILVPIFLPKYQQRNVEAKSRSNLVDMRRMKGTSKTNSRLNSSVSSSPQPTVRFALNDSVVSNSNVSLAYSNLAASEDLQAISEEFENSKDWGKMAVVMRHEKPPKKKKKKKKQKNNQNNSASSLGFSNDGSNGSLRSG